MKKLWTRSYLSLRRITVYQLFAFAMDGSNLIVSKSTFEENAVFTIMKIEVQTIDGSMEQAMRYSTISPRGGFRMSTG